MWPFLRQMHNAHTEQLCGPIELLPDLSLTQFRRQIGYVDEDAWGFLERALLLKSCGLS